MLPGILQFPQQGLQHEATIGIDFDTVTVKRECLSRVAEQGNKPTVSHWQGSGILCQVFHHRFIQQAVINLLPYDALPSAASPKKEIKDQPHNRQEHQYQYPCKRLHRITIVEDNDNNCSDDSAKVNNIKGDGSYLV